MGIGRAAAAARRPAHDGGGHDGGAHAAREARRDREAELKHGRLAMLAAAGWPVSELVQPWLSKALGAPDLLAAGDEARHGMHGSGVGNAVERGQRKGRGCGAHRWRTH